MKKSSRIRNTIKYFGISSATLLAAAPVVAPAVSSVLGWYGANSAFTAKTGEKVAAATQLGTFDRTGYSEYDKLFQAGVKMSVSGDSLTEIPAMQTITGSVDETNGEVENGISAGTLDGLQKLAQLTGGYGAVPGDVFGAQNKIATAEDLVHYMFTNTDGSDRTNSTGITAGLITSGQPLRLFNTNGIDFTDSNEGTGSLSKGPRVASAIRYISSYLHGGTAAGVLSSSVFGDPNKATMKVYIDGQNGANTPSLDTLLKEGVITITLVAQSGDYYGRTAQANIVLRNSNVLFKGVDANEIPGGIDTTGFIGTNDQYKNGSLLSNVSDLSGRLLGLAKDNNNSAFVPAGAVPTLQTGTEEAAKYVSAGIPGFEETKGSKLNYFLGYDPNGTGNPQPWQDNDPKGVDYFAGSAAAEELKSDQASVTEKSENVGAYTTGSIVVPKGTSYQTIVNSLAALKYIGTPTTDVYKAGVKTQAPLPLAFNDVKARPGSKYQTWDDFLASTRVVQDNFFDKNGGENSSANSLSDAVVGHSFSVEVPVYGDLKLGGKRNESPDSAGAHTNFDAPEAKNTFIKDYGASKPRVTARVNVIVYDAKKPEYSIGTKPSFAVFNKSANSNAIYSTVYDDGAELKQNELPETLSKALKFEVKDSRFTTNGEVSAQKLSSYIAEQFGQSVIKKEILISDEDKANSDNKVDLSNLPKDTDFPNANKYTIRSDNRGANISVDASGVDLSKAGSGTLKITYTNSKNEHGVGTESSTITVPYQVGVATNPVFYFVNGIDQTIKAGDNFNPMLFKVTQDQDSMDSLVSSGAIYDQAPYVNNPSKTGLDVTVGGSVDTNTPGNYTLTYTAKNVATGATTTLSRKITVIANNPNKEGYEVTDFKTIGYINYVPGYGIAVYDAPNGEFTGQRLSHGSAWKISHQAIAKSNSKDVWYQVGKNQWIKGSNVSMTPVSQMKYFNAIGQVNYVPGYSIKVWKNADKSQWTGKYLRDGSSWKVFGEQNGFYNVGGNQWVEKQYVDLNK